MPPLSSGIKQMDRNYCKLSLDVDLPQSAVLLALHHDLEGFRLILEEYAVPPSFRRFKISFASTPFAVRMIDEGDYLSTGGTGGGVVSKVENSEYLAWFNEESQYVREDQKLTHYAIYTINECFDIIHSETPNVAEL